MWRIWALFETRTGRFFHGYAAEGSAASCVTPAWSGSTSCVAEAATPSTIGRNAAGRREHISRRFSSIFTSHRRRQKTLWSECQYYPHPLVFRNDVSRKDLGVTVPVTMCCERTYKWFVDISLRSGCV